MSYIVPRDKPQECMKCPYINQYNDCRLIWGSERIRTVEEQYQHCPLTEIPTPHGDLIDRDKLLNQVDDISLGYYEVLGVKEDDIDNAPTVIEAED